MQIFPPTGNALREQARVFVSLSTTRGKSELASFGPSPARKSTQANIKHGRACRRALSVDGGRRNVTPHLLCMQAIVAWHFPLCILIIAIAIQHDRRLILVLVLAMNLNLAKNVAKVVVLTRSTPASGTRGALVIDLTICPQSSSLSVPALPGDCTAQALEAFATRERTNLQNGGQQVIVRAGYFARTFPRRCRAARAR